MVNNTEFFRSKGAFLSRMILLYSRKSEVKINFHVKILKEDKTVLITLDIMNFYVFLAYISLKIATEWMNLENSMLSDK